MDKKQIAIIPASGGSKRLPKKNIMDFMGKPMIAHTIEAAIKTNLFDRVIVSTDSEEIAEISRVYGAEVPFLRDQAADDNTHISVATAYALTQAENYFGETYENVAQLMPNCPIRNAHCIKKVFESHCQRNSDFSISCFKFNFMNPWWAVKVDKLGNGEWLWKDTIVRSQDLPELHCPSGAVWVAKCDALKREKNFYGKNHKYVEISWIDAMDIDSKDDFAFACCLAEYIKKNSQNS